jgi:NAD-dependent DNA ligase
MNPTRDTLNPSYAIKYKVADASNLAVATVKEVEWNVSKHGYLKPRVCIHPIELVGVTIKHATGFNAKFIFANKIGPGAKVEITRSGDVIPFIQKVVKGAKQAQMPDTAWDWNETGVDIFTTGVEWTFAIAQERMVDFFAGIDAPLLKKGNVEKLIHAGFDTTAKIINATPAQLKRVIGANGKKIYDGLRKKLTNIPLYTLMGSTTYFGRGVGRRKFKKLQEAVGFDQLLYDLTERKITAIDGFEEKTARKIINGMGDFDAFIEECGDSITFAADKDTSTGSLVGEKIVFTGFRDKELTALTEDAGATMQSGVSGKTTILVAKNPNSNSGKMKKARANGVRILGIDEFKEIL